MARSDSTRPHSGFRPGSVSGAEAALLALFFLSGAAALVYEVVWTRELTYVFGGSAFAIATVLAAFMAGLALGSAALGRFIDRRGNPLVVYALLEAGIGAFALVLPRLFGLMDPVYAGLYRNLDAGPHTLGLVRFALSFLVLLVPTTLMGGTLPVLGRLLIRNDAGLGLRAGLLYGVNTLGAVVGVAAGGFVLLPALGLRQATLAAVAVNLVVTGLALLLARRTAERRVADPGTAETRAAGESSHGEASARDAVPADPSPALRRTVLAVYAASGFAALAYEVAWTKTLSMILGTTTYAFSAMLMTFLLGLAVGSAVFARVADRVRRPAAVLALVQAGIPLLALAALPLMGTLPQRFVDAYPAIEGSWVRLDLYRVLLAGSVMFLPTLLMGATFPLVSRVYLGRNTVGASLGSLYAANTVGAILGSFITGFVLVPFLGRQASVLVACGVNLAAVLLLLPAVRWREVPALRPVMAGLLVASIPAFLWGHRPWDARVLASGAYVYADKYAREPSIRDALAGDHLVFYDEGTEGTVSVWQREYQTTLRINGKVDASSHGDRVTQKLLAHLPALYHRDPMTDGLVIGLGSGVSAGGLLAYPIDRVETVELMPGMVEAAHRFDAYNRRPLDDPRHRLIVNDGRNHLRLTDRRYDVIVSEPSNPWIAGIGSLFTREFFQLACDRLKPGGILSQWVQIYDFSEDDLRAVFATVTEVFPYVHAWMASPGDLILIASEDPLELDPDALRRALNGVPGEDLASVEILPVDQLLSCFITDEAGLAAYAGKDARRVTDDNLYLETAVPRHMVDGSPRVRLSALETLREPASRLFAGKAPAGLDPAAERYRSARMLAYRAHYEGVVPPGETEAQTIAAAHRMAPGELLARKLDGARQIRDGIRAMRSGDPETAAAILDAVSRNGLREQQATALLYLGPLAMEAGDTGTAEARWRRCLSLEPRYPEAYVSLGDLALKTGRLDEARDLLAKAIDITPTHTAARVRQAQIHALRGEWSEARACLEPARRGDPGSLELAMIEGAVALKTGRTKRAIERFQTVLAAEPRKAEAVYNLAVAYEGREDYAAAAATWKRYLELRPGNAEARQSLAWIRDNQPGVPVELEATAPAPTGTIPPP